MISEFNKDRKEIECSAKSLISVLGQFEDRGPKKEIVENILFDSVATGNIKSIKSLFRFPEIYNLIDEKTLDDAINLAPNKLIEKMILWEKHALFSINRQMAQRIH